MSNLDISSWYVPEVEENVAGDEITGELNFEMPNEIIARKQAESEAQQLMNQQGSFPEVPELPDASVPSSGGEGVTMGEEVSQAVSPIVNPVMEVIDAVNNTTYGFAFDALRAATYGAVL
jgi:hypothetical protein